MTFIGAQIPCTWDIDANVAKLKEVIDTAKDMQNNTMPDQYSVGETPEHHTYVVTPEGFLSGYIPDFLHRGNRKPEDIFNAEFEVTDYAKKKGIGLFLGTLFVDDDNARRNQCRVYDTKGNFLKAVNKTYVTDFERTLTGQQPSGGEFGEHGEPLSLLPWKESVLENNIVEIPNLPLDFRVACWMCNDMWGGPLEGAGDAHRPTLARIASGEYNVQMHVHISNAVRGNNLDLDEMNYIWHEAWLRAVSFNTQTPILHVDNSCRMDGTPWSGPTASPSGLIEEGRYKIRVPNGEQIFHCGYSMLRD